MIQRQAANQADFLLRIGGVDHETLRVLRFSGDEQLGRLFGYRIEIACDQADLPLADLIGAPAHLEIVAAEQSRHVHGIVMAMQRIGQRGRRSDYVVELVPQHWLLTRRRGCRIFQEHNCPDMSVPGIVAQVIADAGLPADSLRLALERDYAPREYVVQYRESEWDFIARLLEEEGIFCFFDQDEEGHTLVLGDSPVACQELASPGSFPFRNPQGLVEQAEFITRFEERHELQCGAVSLEAFDFVRPANRLDSHRAGDARATLEDYDFPDHYVDRPAGERYAQLRLEAHEVGRRGMSLAGTARTLTPGHTFELLEHPLADLNARYLVTGIRCQGASPQGGEEEAGDTDDSGYQVEGHVIPATVPFRPARSTPRPRVWGSQTALVVGPESEEIYTDKYGRVKVQFHWDREGDRDEFSSCWIRVSQGSAGGQYGMLFLPRVGQEVIVDFLEGNPDRPIITGRVYNADQMPPYALPEHKTRSTIKTNSTPDGQGTNEIRFEDKTDEEHILIHAQKDLHVRTRNDRVEHVGHERHTTIRENDLEKIEKSRKSDVGLDHALRVGGDKIVEVSGNVAERFRQNHHEHVERDYYLRADNEIVIEAGRKLTIKAGGNFLVIDEKSLTMLATMLNLNSGGIAGVGSAVSVDVQGEVAEALDTDPGRDTRYDEVNERPSAKPDEDDEEASWIELEMIDESGQPWPNEAYEILTPDGEVIHGQLDAAGRARVRLKNPDLCEVSFTNLDAEAWERA